MIQQTIFCSASSGGVLGPFGFDVLYRGDAVNLKSGGAPATANGDALATLVDQSGNGIDATVTGTITLKLAQINGRNALRCTGGYGTLASQVYPDDFTLAFVGTMTGAGGDDFIFGSTFAENVFFAEGSAAKLSANNGVDAFESSALSPGKASLNAFLFVREGSTLTFYQNGTARGTADFGVDGVDVTKVFSAGGLTQFSGDVALVGGRGTAMDATERDDFFAACRSLWGTP